MPIRIIHLLLALAATHAAAASGIAQQRRSVIAGLVISTATLDPIGNVRVTLIGAGRSMLTDSLGRFRFDSLRAATYLVQARGDSDETPMTSVTVGERERVDLQVRLGKADPNRLPDLVTTAEGPPADPMLRLPKAFVEHQKLGIGQFFTRAELARRRPPTVADLFRGIRGMEVYCHNGLCTPHVVRAPNCAPKVYVDGAMADAGVLRGIDRDDLQAVEVYLGVSEYPPDFSMNPAEAPCGLIVVWTRFTSVRKR